MTFDLSPELASAQAAARELATTILQPAAASIDATASIPGPVAQALEELGLAHAGLPAAVLMVEELAAVSASAAAWASLGAAGTTAGFAGLRGVPRIPVPSPRQHLLLAAVCVGVGRAAVEEARAASRARGERPMGDPGSPPHWALADAATEVEAARLLVQAAPTSVALPAAAVLVFAAGAATRAVDAALRIVGAEGFTAGSVLERLSRDARTACLIVGTEDGARQVAADGVLGVPGGASGA